MVKTIAINEVFTPPGNVLAANSIIGNVVPDNIRFSPGSLAASVLANSTARQLLVCSFSTMAAFTITGSDHQDSVNSPLTGTFPLGNRKLVALESSVKSKALAVPSIPGLTVEAFVTSDGTALETDPLLVHLLTPEAPRYTLLSLLNEIESFYLDREELDPSGSNGVLLVVDQFDESVTVWNYATTAEADAAVLSLLGQTPLTSLALNAVFDMIVETSGGPTINRFGWE